MMRVAASLSLLALVACTPASPPAEERAALAACDAIALDGALTPAQCTMQVGAYRLDVTYHETPEGVEVGTVSAELIDANGAIVQSLLEPEVAEYHAPSVQDIDGDGRADLIITRAAGNPNSEMALWIYNGERGVFERVGHASGVSIARTEDGLIAVPARSSAVAWNVAFYKLDEGGLHPMATVAMDAPAGRSTEPGCRLVEAPGLRDLDLSEEAARAKFCAEPVAAGVFQ